MSQAFGLKPSYVVKLDPTVTSVNAPKGSFLLFSPTVGTPAIYQKQDDGDTVNWTVFSGSSPTGDPNTLAYFDGAGNLADNLDAGFENSNNSMFFGRQVLGGTITSSAIGSLAHGRALGAGSQLISSDIGAQSFGNAFGGSVISAIGPGALAYGSATGAGSAISSNSRGSTAFGGVDSGASIQAIGGDGNLAFGSAVNNPGSSIQATNNGALAHGFADSGFNIIASANGSHASGRANAGNILASGLASFVHGDLLNVNANFATAFGLGNAVHSYAGFVVGRFAVPFAGTLGAWAGTDPCLVVGNGTGVGTEANAFQIDQDGKQLTTGAHRDKLRVITGTDTLSARTDFKAIANAGAGAFNLNLPQGEQGLNFVIGASGANTGVFTVVPFAGDTLDANIQTIFNTNQPVPITFDLASLTWFAI